tara:strand:+ start:250 stop:1524 length:1275 start_codon:yes stop_codon:yes gene_type:complete
MACKQPYDDEFMSTNLNHSFVNKEYKEHRKTQLYDLEISRIPSTMALATNEKEARIKDKKLNEVREEIILIRQQLYKREREYNRIRRDIETLRNTIPENKYKFTMRCSKEQCKGFLSTAYKCGLCNSYTCPTCLQFVGENKDTQHICDPDMIKTAELIKNSTKGCPSCGERIQKIDGCNQMWCPECKQAFDWVTGKIETGPIHNPEYILYLQQNNNQRPIPRNPGDVVCGGIPYNILRYITAPNFRSIILNPKYKTSHPKNEYYHHLLLHLTRAITHITEVTVPDFRRSITRYQDNTETRIKFMLNDIDTETFKSKLYKNDIERKRVTAQLNIWELFTELGIDLLNYIKHCFPENILTIKPNDDTCLNQFNLMIVKLEEFKNFIEYTNKSSEKITNNYNIKTIRIGINKNGNVSTTNIGKTKQS